MRSLIFVLITCMFVGQSLSMQDHHTLIANAIRGSVSPVVAYAYREPVVSTLIAGLAGAIVAKAVKSPAGGFVCGALACNLLQVKISTSSVTANGAIFALTDVVSNQEIDGIVQQHMQCLRTKAYASASAVLAAYAIKKFYQCS